jgi:hypothetical protein
MSSMLLHPALILVAGALLLPFLRGTARECRRPAQRRLLRWSRCGCCRKAVSGRCSGSTTSSRRCGGQALAPVRHHLRPDGVCRRRCSPATAEQAGNPGRLPLCRLGDRRGAGRRPGHGLRVLGSDGVGSTLVLWSAGTRTGLGRQRRYVMIHLAGGVILFAGITGHCSAPAMPPLPACNRIRLRTG